LHFLDVLNKKEPYVILFMAGHFYNSVMVKGKITLVIGYYTFSFKILGLELWCLTPLSTIMEIFLVKENSHMPKMNRCSCIVVKY
jgi:hypothetical protein